MKTVEVSVDFIKEAHQSACANWKQRIEKELPYLFKNNLKAGDWIKMTSDYCSLKSGMVFQIIGKQHEFISGDYYVVAHSVFGIDISNYLAPSSKRFVLATEEEVKTALVNEAVKRGFELGKKVKWNFYGSEGYKCSNITKDWFEYFVNENRLELSSGIIFDNGKWATLITEPTEKELLGDKIKDLEKNLEEVKSLYDKL